MAVSIRTILFSQSLVLATCLVASCLAAERPTFNHNTRDPRPDIFCHPIYYATTEYRREYNRPRCVTGWLASKVAPSSQEAMVWRENYRAGAYAEKHMPPRYKRYFAPKPWEVLLTGARPDFPKGEDPLAPRLDPELVDPELANPERSADVPPPLPDQVPGALDEQESR